MRTLGCLALLATACQGGDRDDATPAPMVAQGAAATDAGPPADLMRWFPIATLRARLQGVWLVHGSWGAPGGSSQPSRRIATIHGDQVVVRNQPAAVTLPLQFQSPCAVAWPDAVDPSRGYTVDTLAIGKDRVVAEEMGPALGVRVGSQLAVCVNLFVVTSDGRRCWQWDHDSSAGRVDAWHVTGEVSCQLDAHFFRFHYKDVMREEQSLELEVAGDLLLPVGGGVAELERAPSLAAAQAMLGGVPTATAAARR